MTESGTRVVSPRGIPKAVTGAAEPNLMLHSSQRHPVKASVRPCRSAQSPPRLPLPSETPEVLTVTFRTLQLSSHWASHSTHISGQGFLPAVTSAGEASSSIPSLAPLGLCSNITFPDPPLKIATSPKHPALPCLFFSTVLLVICNNHIFDIVIGLPTRMSAPKELFVCSADSWTLKIVPGI